MSETPVVEVFADVACPFTHLGLLRFVRRRSELGRDEVGLRVRSWPLEIVNGAALDPRLIGEEVEILRQQIAPELFAGFTESAFPHSSMPALSLAFSAYDRDIHTGEHVSLELRSLLFEQGVDIADVDVLAGVAERHGIESDPGPEAVLAEHAEGVRRGVVGSPHFFTPAGGFFCPALDVRRDDRGHLRILADPAGFDAFIASCFA